MFGCCIRDDAARADFEAVTCAEEEPVEPIAEEPAETIAEEPAEPIAEEPQYVEEPKGAPPPEEPAPPSSQRVIVFTTLGGEDVTVNFTKESIGITFNNKLPIKVDAVKGQAEELGVQPGWVFKSIDGSPVEGKDFKTVKAELVALGQPVKESTYVEAPKSAALNSKNVVVFTTPGGEDVAITFTKAPIGITFNDKELPLKTDTVKGHAEELGVQSGWLFKSIGGSPVEGKDFRTVKAELVAISQSLRA